MRARGLSRGSPSPFSYSSLKLTAQNSAEGLKKEVSRLRKRNKILVALSLILVVLASLIVFSPLLIPRVSATIAQAQGHPVRGTGTTTLAVNLVSAPTSGNVVIAVIGAYSGLGTPNVSSITETNVAWNFVVKDPTFRDVEIWYGVVSASASANISISISPSAGSIADVCEYSGLATASTVDKTATNCSFTTPDTGTTGTTSTANELWIGGIYSDTYTLSNPTNGFTLYDGVGVSYLEKIVSATGQANCRCSGTAYKGSIATFVAGTAATDYPPTYTTIGSNETIAGNAVNCYVLWVANSSNPSYFIFSTNNTGPWVNQTATAVSSNWGNYSFTLNTTVGVPVGWKEWCNDTGGSWNSTAIQTITTTFYASITVTTTTHSWTVNPGDNNVTINENAVGGQNGYVALTVTANANFDIGAKADGSLTYGSNTIALTNTNMSGTTWSVAVALTTSYQTVPGLSNVASGTGLSEKCYLWLSCPTNKPAGAYTETITFEIITTGGSY